MERSANLDLPFIMPSQAQKHVTHHEALLVIDALLHCAVEDRTRGDLPAAPAEGQQGGAYIINYGGMSRKGVRRYNVEG